MSGRAVFLLFAVWSGAANADLACPKTTGEWRALIQDIYRYFAAKLGDNTSYTPDRTTIEKTGLLGRCFEEGVPEKLKACVEPSRKLMAYLVNTGKLRRAGANFHEIQYNEVFPKGFKGPSYIASQFDEQRGAISSYNPGPWTLGFNGDDKRYLEATGAFTDVPLELRSQEFLDNTSDLKRLPKAEAYLEQVNKERAEKKLPPILYATYKPIAADNTMERMTLYFPGNPAKWVAVTIGADPTFSVVGVEKREKGKLEYQSYFRDHKKVIKGDKVTLFSPTDAVFPTDCRGCHKSGPILPTAKTDDVRPKGTKDYAKMREIMGTYPPMGFGEMSGPPYPLRPLGDPADLPKIKPALTACIEDKVKGRPDRYPGYYQGETLQKELLADSIKRVQKTYSCTDCHDGLQRAELIPPFGPSVGRYLSEGLMPPHNKLTKEERKFLDDCFEAVYLRTEGGSVVLSQLIEGCPADKEGSSTEKESSDDAKAKEHGGGSQLEKPEKN